MPAEKQHSTSDRGPGVIPGPLSGPAHALTYETVIRELGTALDDGLSPEEARRRLGQYGPNKLDEGESVSIAKILLRQVANAMMLVKRPTLHFVA
ncbi:hypothetical protein AtubIFM57258_004296 [Aspergillus tubingensis]|nr:hypothetical protein AtubIFM57258_004296 [Aspergillus tubingensis]